MALPNKTARDRAALAARSNEPFTLLSKHDFGRLDM
jgi:hypothetical protein